jgi:hypothetical protein
MISSFCKLLVWEVRNFMGLYRFTRNFEREGNERRKQLWEVSEASLALIPGL